MFGVREKPTTIVEEEGGSNSTPDIECLDIEDMGKNKTTTNGCAKPVVITQNRTSSNLGGKRKRSEMASSENIRPKCDWREILGPAPKLTSANLADWIKFHKRKWLLQIEFRAQYNHNNALGFDKSRNNGGNNQQLGNITRSISNFVQKTTNTKMQKPWQILRITEHTNSIGRTIFVYKQFQKFSNFPYNI